ncbi:MAG: nucleotidyltransferase family protein [Synergistaceae bacterium]|nr:nucleotidyltransferase family protein [Synergistaceae bacterium]
MKITTGIIAEFNPLHLGHEALLASVEHPCVVVLSSNFVQRGSPAFADKFTRARMALNSGADLVIELSFLFSCSAGQDFAKGAVNLLSHFAGTIAFGMEDPDFDVEAVIFAENTPAFAQVLRQKIGRGASYPKAYALALEAVVSGAGAFITKPNNMLAISYMRENFRNSYGLKILPVKRQGGYSSRAVREGNFGMMPEFSRKLVAQAKEEGRISDEGRLWPMLQGIFLRSSAEDLRSIHGIDEGIEGLFLRHWRDAKGMDDFVGRCVCARYTRAKIRRSLVYVLLGLNRWEVMGAMRGGVPYARVLGFNDKGREILRKTSGIRVITRLAEVRDKIGKYFADVEFRASQLYELTLKNSDFKRETQKPVIIQAESQ